MMLLIVIFLFIMSWVQVGVKAMFKLQVIVVTVLSKGSTVLGYVTMMIPLTGISYTVVNFNVNVILFRRILIVACD